MITRIEDKNGDVLFDNADTGERVLDEKVAGAVTNVLRGVFEKSYATAYGSGPSNGQTVAGKTGTGVEFRDHWLVGYSPTLTCAAWIGNRDYSSTSESLTANSLWPDFMSLALANTPTKPFPIVDEPTYNTTQDELMLDGDEEDEDEDYDIDDEDEDEDAKSKSSSSASSKDEEDEDEDEDEDDLEDENSDGSSNKSEESTNTGDVDEVEEFDTSG